MAPPLSDQEIYRLKRNFLVKLEEMSRNSVNKSTEISNVFDSITSAYNKDLVMPLIVQELIDEGLILLGDNKNEVRLNPKAQSQAAKRGVELLKTLNHMVNLDENARVGITLNVKGLLISGNLIGLKAYYKGVSQILQEADRKNSNLWASLFDDLIENLPKDRNELSVLTHLMGAKHICIENARYYPSSSPLPTNIGLYWIGLVESVDGFTIGSFGEVTDAGT